MDFAKVSGKYINTIPPSDASLFELVATVVREEPLDAVDPETRGLLAAIGIRKDTPFAPDARMQAILAEAAAVGNATARAITFGARERGAYVYPDGGWKTVWIGNDYEFSPDGVLNLDGRTLGFHPAFGISPVLTVKMVGVGSQYVLTERDAAGRYLDGAKTYRLHLPPGIPAKDFWSVTVYDPQTRSMLQTDQRFPSTGSQKQGIVIKPDTSVDVFFGPEPPPGREANWVADDPRQGVVRLPATLRPTRALVRQDLGPGEIELVAGAPLPA